MISDFKELNRLFEEIDGNISENASFYVIGGAMLLYYGMKPATKDIDIIVDKKSEFSILQNLLKKIGFTAKAPAFGYENVDLSQIFIRGDFRIDLFHKIVCKGFQLSDAMIKRAQKVLSLNHLSVYICSPEDVFLFKTFTERDGDITDCLSIAQKKKIDWNIMLEELKSQIKISGNSVWITFVGERLDILEERGLVIPIIKEVDILREKYFDALEKRI